MSTAFQEDVVRIDELNLDRECLRLPTDYLKASTSAAEAKRALMEAERQKDLVEAEIAKAIRQSPASFGLEKVTEAAIAAAVQLSPKFQDALRALNEARFSAETAQALVWAIEAKKKSLSMLVDLHGMGYFSEVSLDSDGRELVQRSIQRRVRRPHQKEAKDA